jgi:hypothetical protein
MRAHLHIVRLAAALLAVVALTIAVDAHAFKAEGHEAIEGLAYQHMLARPARASCGSDEEVVSGKEELRYLVSTGVLAKPRCFDVRADSIDARVCEEDDEEGKWPVLGSGRPDDVYARQFGGDGQCFHFMAEPSDVWSTESEPFTGVARGLSQNAYRRCVQAITTLWDELLEHPEGARSVDRGMYALIHAVEDSYSAAHVERDDRWRILYLKAWDLVSGPFLWHPSALGYFGTERQHQFDDERDNAWRSGQVSPRCPEHGTPITFAQHAECFSPRAYEAASAVEDLLDIAYCAFREAPIRKLWRGDGDGPHAPRSLKTRARWASFLHAHFTNANPAAGFDPDEALAAEHRERTPELLLGLRGRTQWDAPVASAGGLADLSLVVDVFPPLKGAYPFIGFLGVEPGLRWRGAARSVGFTIDPGAFLPLSESLAIGLSPISIESYWSIDRQGYPDLALLGSVRLDAFFRPGLWATASSPRFEWSHGTFRRELSLAVGYAWDMGSADAPASPGYRDVGLDWQPRELRPRVEKRPTIGIYSAGAQVAPDSGYGVRAVIPEILVTPHFWSWLELGGALSVQSMRRDDTIGGVRESLYLTSMGLLSRVRLWPFGQRILGVGVTPVEVDLGDASGLNDVYWDVQSTAQVFLRFATFEIAADSPPYYWFPSRANQVIHAGGIGDVFVRFGWVQAL